jgi:hypothetical protein
MASKISRPEPRTLTDAVARACGIGELDNCCAFLLLTGDGFECAQRSAYADILFNAARARQFKAHRTPESDFPSCQQEGRTC